VLPPARTVEIPCCYGGELGFELEAAAARIGLPPDEVARLHAAGEYHVYFVGFTPGLPYMTGMSDRLAIPRLATPRTRTPPGSVSIGGGQCAIYPVESPGGFWVLGRTPLRLYDPGAENPILLRAGDRVRFRMIDRAEYDAIALGVEAGTYAPRIEAAPG
jgi:inhibitor of KinA